MLSVVKLSVAFYYYQAKCHNAECHNAECQYAERRGIKFTAINEIAYSHK